MDIWEFSTVEKREYREGWKREVLKNLVGVWKKNHSLPYLIERVNVSYSSFQVDKNGEFGIAIQIAFCTKKKK